jgi:mono/diheme cytochrome c family protein
MRNRVALLAAVLWFLAPGFAQQKETQEKKAPEKEAEFKIPPEEAKKENTVKPTPTSVAAGAHIYESQCKMCHGPEGDGKGDLAIELKLKMRDYRDPEALKGFTDGELNYILTTGKGRMPGQGERMTAEQRWNLINYFRSLSKKEPPPKK